MAIGKILRCMLLLVAGAWLSVPACASVPSPRPWVLPGDLVFENFTSPVAANLTVMAQDAQGFLWLGSQQGLLRWDGYRFHTYGPDPDIPGTLPDTYVRTLFVDAHSRLWVGTSAGGLARYDPAKDDFIPVALGTGKAAASLVTAIVDDGADGLLVGSDQGVDHVDATDGRTVSLRAGIPKGGAYALLHDRTGALWIGTRTGLLRRVTPGAPATIVPLANRDGVEPTVTTLFADSAGRIWVGTKLNGAFVIAPGTQRAVPVHESGPTSTLESDKVTAITEARDGQIWVGTYAGLVRVDAASGRTWRERHQDGQPSGLPDDEVHALYRDHTGLVWVATSTALSRNDPRPHMIDTLFGGADRQRLVGHANVPSLLALADGRVWIAVGEGGVDILDPERGRVGELRPDPRHPDHALPKGRIMTMAQAPDGSVYLGTQGGLYRASTDGRDIRRILIPQRSPTSITWTLNFDQQRLWIGGDDGLWQVSLPAQGPPVVHRHLETELGSSMVTSLLRGRGGSLWVGTYTGLVHLDVDSGLATRMPIDPEDRGQLPGGHTSALLLDRSGRLWVGSFGRGIQIQDGPEAGSRTRFRRLTAHDGLPQNSVDMLLMDGNGDIWATTDDGLAQIDARTLKVRAYRIAEGVGVLDNWTGSGTRTPAGELMFGGLGGLTIVHPDRSLATTAAPPLVITEAHVGERALPTAQVLEGRRIDLGADERNLMLEFAALHYADPEHLSYSYRLLDFDKAWIATPISRRLVSYTNLPPGDFTLQLRATKADGAWTAPLDVAIHVQPAWYQHGAVRALGAALALALLGGLVHLRTLYLRRRQRELQRLVAERTAELERRTRELHRSQEQLQQMAYFDSLTGLPNRRMFNDELRRLVAQSGRGQGDFALLLVDLDGFKQINDLRGHDVGDHLLAAMAQRLAALMRESDRVARLGGDEFAVLLAQPCSAEAIESACARLLAQMREPLDLAGTPLQVSASIGVAVCPHEGKAPGALYKAADQALYEAKRAGRNTWRRVRNEPCAA